MIEDGRNSHATFQYGTRYAARADVVPVDPLALPLPSPDARPILYRTEPDFAVFNGIRDAAPDAWGRRLMDRAAGAIALDEFDYLVASGETRVGALAFGPTPEGGPLRQTPWGDAQPPEEAIDLAEVAEAVDKLQDLQELDPHVRDLLDPGSALGGARPKAATIKDGRPWIAKFPSRGDPYSFCSVEFAAMRLAAACGLNVPRIDLTMVADKAVYLIERFDRQVNRPDRVPYVSGLTLLGAHERDFDRYSYADLASAVRQLGTHPLTDLRELYRRMVFNILVTNDDDHLRNHGFLYDGAGWRLSPLFDVMPKPQAGSDRRLVLGVGTEGRLATLKNALSDVAAFGLTPEEAGGVVETLRAQVHSEWRTHFTQAGLTEPEISRFATCFAQAAP